MGSMRNAPASTMRTGRIGTRNTSSTSSPGSRCHNRRVAASPPSAAVRQRSANRTLSRHFGRRVNVMSNRILVFYGSYRSDRTGIRLAEFVVKRLQLRGDDVELIDAKAINLPMLDRMYKEYPEGEAPPALEQLAHEIRATRKTSIGPAVAHHGRP